MKTRGYALGAAIAALIAGGMTLLPWVSLEDRGLPMKWAGLGIYYGDDIGMAPPSINPLGWAVVVVAVEALVLLGVELFGGQAQTALKRWLYLALAGLSAAVAALMVVVLAAPSILYGGILGHLGKFVGEEDVQGGRDVLNVSTLSGVILWLVVAALVALFGFRATSRVTAG
ncbi:hypothetical protein [Gordonia sp. (in: high G+C Gram-positive bacteria)]|uniref:hypothetical protein n=1 Tax=Gordonia sp. (in: high G+C Gram-positive bacteria) TaxID=84139 RepID=UPI0039E2BF07